ncbi:MAG: FHA domain-containing protein [Candidatus Sulfotelmatobacter sp.]
MEILLSIRSKSDSSVREVKSAISDGLVIGRGAEGGILLEGPDLSREHLVITADGSDTYITDLSSNGTWLNGVRLKRSAKSRFTPEDLAEIPGYAITFSLTEEPSKLVETPVTEMPPRGELRSFPIPPVVKDSGFLDPAFRFLRSFTLLEKFLILVGCSGLFLLYAYVGL